MSGTQFAVVLCARWMGRPHLAHWSTDEFVRRSTPRIQQMTGRATLGAGQPQRVRRGSRVPVRIRRSGPGLVVA